MSETQNQQPFDPNQAAQTGLVLQQHYETLVTDWQATGQPEGTSYPADRQELEGLMSTQAENIFTGTGVEPTAADFPVNGRTSKDDLKLAVNVAEEATTLGFTLEGDDQAATEQAKRLIEDYNQYTEPLLKDRDAELSSDYAKHQQSKLLLVESSARDLARRAGIENPVLDRDTTARIKEATGVGFAERRHGYAGPVRVVERTPAKRENNPNYMGPPGTPLHVGGLGSAAIAGYQYGKPVVRGRDGSLQTTFGRY